MSKLWLLVLLSACLNGDDITVESVSLQACGPRPSIDVAHATIPTIEGPRKGVSMFLEDWTALDDWATCVSGTPTGPLPN
jgi:hypothetical protein